MAAAALIEHAPERKNPPPLLDSARALLESQTLDLTRDAPDPDPPADEVAERHLTRLRAQHAEHQRARRWAQARNVLARLIEYETNRRAAADATRTRHGTVPSLLEQVCDAVQSSRGNGHRASGGAHRAAIGLTAAELVGSIERAVGGGPRDQLTRRVWAWVRGHAADDAAAWTMAEWLDRARDVVSPPRPVGLVAACPECGRRVVYVDDSGERVRRPALQVDRATGWARCTAPGCRAAWSPQRLQLLARVLEQQAEEGAPDREGVTIRAEHVLFVRSPT